MAGRPISITRGSTTISETTTQSSREALDLQGVNGLRFDFALRTYFVSGSSATATVVIETSMFNDDNPANWETLVSFTTVNSSNDTEIKTATDGVLRYVRWKATLTGTGPSFTFEVVGMAW